MAKLGIIADDLTGALDTGVQFSKQGLRTVVLLGETWNDRGDILVLDTNTRADCPEVAYGKVRKAVRRLRAKALLGTGGYLYKKVDSTLRGNIGRELEAAMDELGIERVIMAPAFPANGRTTVKGCQMVDGVPLAETSFALDPISAVSESHIPTLLRKVLRPLGSIGLAQVEQGARALSVEISARPEAILVVDAVTSDHLQTIARAAVLAGAARLTCGSGGLAQELATVLGLEPDRPTRSSQESKRWISHSHRPVLVISGSCQAVTARQIEHAVKMLGFHLVNLDARQFADRGHSRVEIARVVDEAVKLLRRGTDLVITSTFEPLVPDSGHAIAAGLGEIAQQVLDREEVVGLILTGGDTAVHVCQAIEATAIQIKEEIVPGIPVARLLGGRKNGLRIVTKAGGFGNEHAIVKAAQHLKQSIQKT